MGFDPGEVDRLLADCGRLCCICNRRHRVQVHHIVQGDDNIENGIPLCPNCHDEVHTDYSQGRTTRSYTPGELRLHRRRTMDLAKRVRRWKPGGADWKKDRELIVFFAQVLDRPAFRISFNQERSFVDFDHAMEDTVLALNTGYWRTRNGELLSRFKGKACVVNPSWREQIEKITSLIEDIRKRFHEAFHLGEMLCHLSGYGLHRRHEMEEEMQGYRGDRALGVWMDKQRQEAIDIMNGLLDEVGMQHLRGLRSG
jgi:hypothetical protein